MTQMLRVIWSLAFVTLLSIPTTLGLSEDIFQFVVVSQPRLRSVTYAKVKITQYDAGNETFPLITSGLKNPLGLAVDNVRQRLFVADSEGGKVFMYNLHFDQGNLVTDGRQLVAASGLNPRWVSVNEAGDIYVTDEPSNQISKVTASQLKALDATPSTIFAGSSMQTVSTPGGVAVDDAEVFWVNKAEGTTAGTLIKGTHKKDSKGKEHASAKIISKNVNKAFGCCAAGNNVFYTGEEKYVYGVKKTGGTAVTVIDSMVAPRGCAWDGSSTVYIADRSGNALRYFPSSMHSLQLAQVHTILTVEDPFGVAVALKPEAPSVQDQLTRGIPFLQQSGGQSSAPKLMLTLAIVAWTMSFKDLKLQSEVVSD